MIASGWAQSEPLLRGFETFIHQRGDAPFQLRSYDLSYSQFLLFLWKGFLLLG